MMMNHGIHRIHGMVLLAVAAFGTSLAVFAADPTITVSARQRYPWNGLVDVHFTITGDAGKKYDTSFTATDMVGNTNIAMRTIRKADGTAAAAKEQLLPGTYNWVWDAVADLPKDFKCDRVTVTGTAVEMILYMVIDLSSGPSSSSYPVSYLDAVPSGGWTDTYKTTKLVLRLIHPGTFQMGTPGGEYGGLGFNSRTSETEHTVTITKQFFMGIFEVTQRQYELVTGNNPSTFVGSMRPVEQVTWNDIRGNTSDIAYPGSANVGVDSFVGKMRSRTGQLMIDLPTEAQWEYACRAGTTTALNNGNNLTNVRQDANMDVVGRYGYNNGYRGGVVDGKGGYSSNHTTVGSYMANALGLYDMHGNVWEWCLDWAAPFSDVPATDPIGPLSIDDAPAPQNRAYRGGCWAGSAADCRSGVRSSDAPNSCSKYTGFRLCITIPN